VAKFCDLFHYLLHELEHDTAEFCKPDGFPFLIWMMNSYLVAVVEASRT